MKEEDCCRVSITDKTTSLGSLVALEGSDLHDGRTTPGPNFTSSSRDPIIFLMSTGSLMSAHVGALLLI